MGDADQPRDGSGADVDQLKGLLIQVNRLVLRYRRREAIKPEAEIAGGSRALLINLHRAALEWLPAGPVKESVTELLSDRDVQSPPRPISATEAELADTDVPGPEPLMLSNELDLLEAVVQELEAVAEELLGDDAAEVEPRPTSTSQRGSSPASVWDEGPSGPSTPQNRKRHDARPSMGRADIAKSPTVSTFF